MKYKTPMFDENNKQLKESLTSSHVLNSLAKEMCFRFNLKVLGATRTRNPYSQDLEIDDGSDIANIYGEDTKSNRKGYILGKEGYPVGFISTFYSQRYDCEQFIYSQHTESRDSDTSIKCVKSKSMNTLLSRVKKYFYNKGDEQSAMEVSKLMSNGYHALERVVNMMGSPKDTQEKLRRLFQSLPQSAHKEMANHIFRKTNMSQKTIDEVKNLLKRQDELQAKIEDLKSNQKNILAKPLYVLAYNNNLPNLYYVSKLNVTVDEETNRPTYKSGYESDVFLDDISNSKFSEILKSKLTMWLASRENICEEDTTTKYDKCQGSLYHMRRQSNFHSNPVSLYDEPLGIHVVDYKSGYNRLMNMEYLIFQDVD
tara:strand:+ start:935 stop:2041 length:1107 start_codon:yes stop_codon:yes gene_type:complete